MIATLHRLWFNGESGRWVIDCHELHCGDCFQVWLNDTWHDVRIELAGQSDWYLIGLPVGHSPNPRGYMGRLYQ